MLSSKIAPWLGVLGLGAGGGILLQGTNPGEASEVQLSAEIPTRQQQVQRLAASRPYKKQQNPFDVLIIGGGATGAGIAVDAATRCVHCTYCARNCQLAWPGCAATRAHRAGPSTHGTQTNSAIAVYGSRGTGMPTACLLPMHTSQTLEGCEVSTPPRCTLCTAVHTQLNPAAAAAPPAGA